MFEEIFNGLKTKFDGVQDNILKRVADKLSKTTSKDQVQTVIDGVTIQTILENYGDSRATEAAFSAVNNYEKKHGIKDGRQIQKADVDNPVDRNNYQPDLNAMIQAELAKMVAPIQEKLSGFEKKEKVSSIKNSARAKIFKEFTDVEKSLCDIVLEDLLINESDTEEAVVRNALENYNKYAVASKLSEAKPAIPSASGVSTNGDPSVFAALKAKKQAEGVLPKSEQKS